MQPIFVTPPSATLEPLVFGEILPHRRLSFGQIERIQTLFAAENKENWLQTTHAASDRPATTFDRNDTSIQAFWTKQSSFSLVSCIF